MGAFSSKKLNVRIVHKWEAALPVYSLHVLLEGMSGWNNWRYQSVPNKCHPPNLKVLQARVTPEPYEESATSLPLWVAP